MNPDPPRPEAVYTAWHFYLAYCLEYLLDPAFVEVRAFDKLGILPLEADYILLRRVADLARAGKLPDFDFLWPYLGLYTVVEYKSPADRLTLEDFDKALVYRRLCKLKYKIRWENKLRLMLLYSAAETDLFAVCEQNGFVFKDVEQGVKLCQGVPAKIVAVDLVAAGERFPQSIINLFSIRHREYTRKPPEDAQRAEIAAYVFHAILSKELRKIMDPERLKGMHELTEDIETITRRFLDRIPAEERLRGLPAEERLRGLPAEERLRGLPAEERLRGLPAEQVLKQFGAEEFLAGLSPEARERLKRLLS